MAARRIAGGVQCPSCRSWGWCLGLGGHPRIAEIDRPRVKPSRRHMRNLTDYEMKTGGCDTRSHTLSECADWRAGLYASAAQPQASAQSLSLPRRARTGPIRAGAEPGEEAWAALVSSGVAAGEGKAGISRFPWSVPGSWLSQRGSRQ